MSSSVVFLDDKNFNHTIKVKDKEIKELYILDTLKSDVNLHINIDIETNSKVDIVISSLNLENYTKTFNVLVNHLGDESESYCQVFGVNKDNAKTTFNLEAIIKDTSRGNYCEQAIKGILLSNSAVIEGKPNLIINTNNIKAKHALAIGRLNQAHIFYLQNKGLKKDDAIKLILLSYFNVVLYKLEDEKLREEIVQKIYNTIGKVE